MAFEVEMDHPVFPDGEEFSFPDLGVTLPNRVKVKMDEVPEGLDTHPHVTVTEVGSKTAAKKGGE